MITVTIYGDAEVKSDQVDEKQHDVKPLPKVSPTAVEQTCPQRSLSTDKIVAAVDSLATKLVESQAQLASLQTMVAQLRKDALDANPSSN